MTMWIFFESFYIYIMASFQERVMKVLQVWSDWFLLSYAYVNVQRDTFLRFGNSSVPPFHSICWDAPPLKDLDSSESNLTDITDGSGPNQDVAMVIGEGATTRELFSIPLVGIQVSLPFIQYVEMPHHWRTLIVLNPTLQT